jgi:tetratricopeptide (TPR) repeat protein
MDMVVEASVVREATVDVDWERVAAEGWALRERSDEMLAFFQRLAREMPSSARAHFELANVLDHLGREREAVPEYRLALRLGLPRPFELFALVQLGSSLRNIGAVAEALDVLHEARKIDPDGEAGVLFLCLALHSAGQDGKALSLALSFILAGADAVTRERYGEPLQRYIAAVAEDEGREG